jgi:branched-chain amino acid aminotransferase
VNLDRPLAVTVDGRAHDPDAPALSPLERGFTYGDGLFETIPAPAGRAFEPERHFARLLASAEVLGLPVPPLERLERALEATLAAAGDRTAAVVRITWSRGAGGRGYAPPDDARPQLVVSAWATPARRAEGVRALSVRGLAPGELARHKTLSAIHYVVAAGRARAAGADEALLVDARGRVLETAGANVFAVLGGRVVTPPASLPLFAGIGRARALGALAARGPGAALEQAFDLVALARADEAFLASAVRGIVPLVAVDGRAVGTGTPGPVTTSLTPLPGSV